MECHCLYCVYVRVSTRLKMESHCLYCSTRFWHCVTDMVRNCRCIGVSASLPERTRTATDDWIIMNLSNWYIAHTVRHREIVLHWVLSDNLSLIQEHCQEADGLYHKLLLKWVLQLMLVYVYLSTLQVMPVWGCCLLQSSGSRCWIAQYMKYTK